MGGVKVKLGLGAPGPLYDPDSGITYRPGLASVFSAAWHMLTRLIQPVSLGLGFAALGAAG